eukprot:NODE_26292_length_556_cov_2.314685.p4 GENE.NODE_26292_length_556_cov_2.314685~~NODE_26292_length_556_cov_2.314685.p4  ORF type:complete len:57 (+),score=8.64 NODE_26292_length_556_cov_2.314685:343-513(+)
MAFYYEQAGKPHEQARHRGMLQVTQCVKRGISGSFNGDCAQCMVCGVGAALPCAAS